MGLPSLVAGFMRAASHQQPCFIGAEGPAVFPRAPIKILQLRDVLQRQHVGTLLPYPGEIEAGLVHKGEVGRHYHVVRVESARCGVEHPFRSAFAGMQGGGVQVKIHLGRQTGR